MVESEGTNSADLIKKLNKRRGGIKSQLTVFKDYLRNLRANTELSSLQVKELSLRLEGLRKLMNDYDSIQIQLEEISSNVDEQLSERIQTESLFYSQIALAQDLIDTFKATTIVDSDLSKSPSCHDKFDSIRLPTINLPTFDGNYTRWLEFKDMFESLINNNDLIAPVNKFHYLRNSLQGSASVVIKFIDFSASGYELAWNTLCERYDNKNILINNHLSAIVNITPIQRESFKALRYLLDNVSKNLSSLDKLGISTKGWDPLVIFLVSAKLDPKTNGKWEEYKGSFSRLPSNNENESAFEVPTLEQFKVFLRNRANVLETMYCGRSNENKIVTKDNKYTKSFVTNVEGPRFKQCLVCGQNHHVYQCHKFKAMSIEDRLLEVSRNKLCNNCLRTGHTSPQCTLKGSCRSCRKKHNSLLHSDIVTSNNVVNADISNNKNNSSANLSTGTSGQVLLCTAQVEVNHNNSTYLARVLLDTGSQSSFVTHDLSKKLRLPTNKINSFTISGINNKETEITERVQIKVKSRVNSFVLNADCLVIPSITGNLPNVEVDVRKLDLPDDVELADPLFYKPSQIDILLGADKFFEIINSRQIQLGKDKPILQDSKLGWIVAGLAGESCYKFNVNCHLATTRHKPISLQDVDDSLKRFWEVEDLPSDCNIFSVDEEFCETHYIENTNRLPDGRFSVQIPFKEKPEESLGNSYPIAMKRFLSLEKKLHKNPKVKDEYTHFLKEYADLGHMVEIKRPDLGCYLPHHCVIREQKETTKLRVVFDASAKTSTGKSLNDIQAIGPVVQSDLHSILMRFRTNRFVLTADIEKMYRQISLNEQQRHLQLILWRDQVDQPIKIFQLNTLTYGTASAPFLSTRCLKQLALDCQDEITANVIKNDFYIDDLNTGASTIEELQHIYTNVINVLNSACFPLRKFRTNCPQILENQVESTNCLDFNTEASVLGLKWSPQSDNLHFPIDIEVPEKITKRIIISTTCKLFDPLGLLCCCIIRAKILLQNLWTAKLDWDEPVPSIFEKRWLKFANNLGHLSDVDLPRHVLCDEPNTDRTELHCFVDASQEAYGACVYLRSFKHNSNYITVRLLCAKARVAPIKSLTIPRLELCAGLLGAQLCTKVTQSIKANITKKIIWTDSTVVLGWLKTQSKTLQTFVRNRVNKINELTLGYEWKHVPTDLNPADLASRGIEPQNLLSLSLWWEGPSFLKEDPAGWPTQPQTTSSNLPEVKALLTVKDTPTTYCDPIVSFDRYSSYIRMKRIYAYFFRFIFNCRNRSARLTGPLQAQELKDSLTFLVKKCQVQSFQRDLQNLIEGKPLHHRSRLLSLNPFVDSNGVLRVGGRISNADYNYNKKHPILLDAKHHLAKIIMSYQHLRLYHAGAQLMLSTLREEFWPVGGRNLARSISKQCINCIRLKGNTVQPIMGNLPSVRIEPSSPFHSTGIDFAGPFMIANKKGRGSRNIKAYMCVFVCLTTKAIHLEVVSDLTTEAFILCLRRFVSRRGKPDVIHCDNGKNFVGAHNELGRVLRSSRHPVSNYAANETIDFKFIPAYAPNFGGIWEAGVRSAKHHLKRMAGNANLTFEELATLFIEIEAILNSRPITPLSSDPNDMNPLTPGHFLIGRPLTSVPSLPITGNPANRYKRIEKIRQQFWERWRREFMAELQQRVKWKKSQRDLQIGDLVLLKEDNLMPLQWRRGRVSRLYPGPDGVCRVADIMTDRGQIKRAVNKMCLLPLTESLNDDNTSTDDPDEDQQPISSSLNS